MVKCTFDFSDVDAAFEEHIKLVKSEVDKVGKEAVAVAKNNGNYRDVTGMLRNSNRHVVTDKCNLELINDAPYAASVEARGKDVLSSAALFAEQRLNSI